VKAKKLQPTWLIYELAKTQAQKANFEHLKLKIVAFFQYFTM
jgi:hypothetical protein